VPGPPRPPVVFATARGASHEGTGSHATRAREPRRRGDRDGATRRAGESGRRRAAAPCGWGGPCAKTRAREEGRGRAQGREEGARRGGKGRKREIERERERERGGELTSGIRNRRSPSPNPRAPRGEEKERWRRGSCCAGELNERKEEKGGGVWGEAGRQGSAGQGRAKLGQAGPGWVASQVKISRHAQPLIGIQMRNKIRNETRRTRD
jgi:hypothetical protein